MSDERLVTYTESKGPKYLCINLNENDAFRRKFLDKLLLVQDADPKQFNAWMFEQLHDQGLWEASGFEERKYKFSHIPGIIFAWNGTSLIEDKEFNVNSIHEVGKTMVQLGTTLDHILNQVRSGRGEEAVVSYHTVGMDTFSDSQSPYETNSLERVEFFVRIKLPHTGSNSFSRYFEDRLRYPDNIKLEFRNTVRKLLQEVGCQKTGFGSWEFNRNLYVPMIDRPSYDAIIFEELKDYNFFYGPSVGGREVSVTAKSMLNTSMNYLNRLIEIEEKDNV